MSVGASLPHLASAAFRAASDRCLAVILTALAFPPLRPPFRPRATAAGSLPSSSTVSGSSPVAMAMIFFASLDGSRGMRERLGIDGW